MIEINNLTAISVNEKFLKKIAQKILQTEKIKSEAELSIALLGPARMREINKRYLGKNKTTDVLSFPAFAQGYGGQARSFNKIKYLGEIVICPWEVKKNAKRFGSNFKKELAKVSIHGILSLLGYHHKKGEIEKKEQYYLKQLAISD